MKPIGKMHNLLNVSQNALNRIWQAYRDEAGWLTQKSMNETICT